MRRRLQTSEGKVKSGETLVIRPADERRPCHVLLAPSVRVEGLAPCVTFVPAVASTIVIAMAVAAGYYLLGP